MLLQGNLQVVFDALYSLGVIDPVLKMDWSQAVEDMQSSSQSLNKIIKVANHYQEDSEILKLKLEQFDTKTLSFLAMEVARELASFHKAEYLH